MKVFYGHFYLLILSCRSYTPVDIIIRMGPRIVGCHDSSSRSQWQYLLDPVTCLRAGVAALQGGRGGQAGGEEEAGVRGTSCYGGRGEGMGQGILEKCGKCLS